MSDRLQDWLDSLDEHQRRQVEEQLDEENIEDFDDVKDEVREMLSYDVESEHFDAQDYDDIVTDVWPEVRRRFNKPMIRSVETTDSLLDGTTAAYKFNENEVTVSTMFMDRLAQQLAEEYEDPDQVEDELYDLTAAIEKHEIGHYTEFPRSMKNWLILLKRAEDEFGEQNAGTILNLYADRVDEASLIQSGIGGEDIQQLWKTMVDSDESHYEAIGEKPPEVNRDRVMASIYQEIFPDLPDVFEPTETEQQYLDEFTSINYLPGLAAEKRSEKLEEHEDQNPHLEEAQRDIAPLRWHERNLLLFGNILQDMYEEAIQDHEQDNGAGLPMPGNNDMGDEDDASGQQPIPTDMDKPGPLQPYGGEDLDGIPHDMLDDALDDILREEGRGRYKDIREWLEEKVDGYDDRYRSGGDEENGEGAGIGHAEFTMHDDSIPFYRRWADQFPLHITEKPMTRDESAQYRSGRKSYEMGDKLSDTNIFGSLGIIGTPGISQVDEREAGEVPVEDHGIPDLMVGIDSSGSMPHPDPDGHQDPDHASYGILAAYILGKNYFANGSDVGGYNFSTNMAFKKPDRELDEFYSVMTGRWGGGTVVDTDKLEDFVAGMDHLDDVVFTDEEDYEELINRMPKEYQEKFQEKDIDVNIHEVGGTYERLDHVLITDGMLGNIQETIGYMNEISEYTRNYVFLTNEQQYERWQDFELENTWLFKATEEQDLANLAVGLSSDLHEAHEYE